MTAFVSTLVRADGRTTHATVRVARVGKFVTVTGHCRRCGARVMPPYFVEDGVDEGQAIEAAALLAYHSSRRCGTPEESPGCRRRREDRAKPRRRP